MNKNQFLFSKKESQDNSVKIGEFFLSIGDGLENCTAHGQNTEIHLLGNLYDWKDPNLSNEAILKEVALNSDGTIDQLITLTNQYAGDFVIVAVLNKKIFLFNDAASQREVYFSTDFLHFATQVKTLSGVSELEEHSDKDAIAYYNSSCFKNSKLHIGIHTHKKNVLHLRPNHYINVLEKKVERINLKNVSENQPINEVAKEASAMLKGYLEAVSKRKKLLIGLTAGYDSRILYLASLGLKNCSYYVNKTDGMKDSHYDISIAQKLAAFYSKNLQIIEKDFKRIQFKNSKKEYIESLDFPRFSNIGIDTQENEIVVNGNISEIARNYYGYFSHINSKKLSILNGSFSLKHAISQNSLWLQDKEYFENRGYHVLDMFYWEEKMGNWNAKARTELLALDRKIVTPYNSRDLITVLLSSNRKHRDSGNNKLYDQIIAELSNYKEVILKTPINPCFKTRVILILKKIRLYNIYRSFKMNLDLIRN